MKFISSSFIRSSSFFSRVSASISGGLVSSSYTVVSSKDLGGFTGNFTTNKVEYLIPSQSAGGSDDVKALTISASGDNPRIGIGLSNPIKAFDFKEVRDDDRGGELLIRGSRTTKGADVNDEVGRINFAIDSASFGKIDTSGSAAEIVALVDEVDETGIKGHMSFRTAIAKTGAPTELLKLSQSTSILNSPLDLNGALSVDLSDINASTINRYNNTSTRIELASNHLEFYGNAYGMKVSNTGIDANPSGLANMDFRVRSDNDAAAILVDSGDDTITLGSSTDTHVTASGNISASGDITANNGTFNGNITATGDIIAQRYIVSSSVSHITSSFSSGSTIFGDDITDTHQFTGSLNISGSVTTDTNFTIDSNGRVGINTTSPDYKLDISGNVGVNEYIYHNGDTNTYLRYQTDQIDLSAGGQVASFKTTGFETPGHITASGNISASDTGYFNAVRIPQDDGSLNNRLYFGSAPNGNNGYVYDDGNNLQLGYNDSDILQVNDSTPQVSITGDLKVFGGGAGTITATGKISGSSMESSGDIHLATNNTQISQVLSGGATRDLIGFDGDNNAVIGNPTADKIKLVGNVTASGAISASGTITGNSIVGTLATAAQTNITSVGTLSSLTMGGDIDTDGNNINVNSGEVNGAASIDSNVFKMGNGSVSTPALAFTSDTNTGLYGIAADTLGIAAGGQNKMSIGSISTAFNNNTISISATDGDGAVLDVTNNFNSVTSADHYGLKVQGGGVVFTGGGSKYIGYGIHTTAGPTNTGTHDTIALFAQGDVDGEPHSYAAVFSGSAGGVVGINTMEPTVELEVSGDGKFSGALEIGGISDVSASIAAASGGGAAATTYRTVIESSCFFGQSTLRYLPFNSLSEQTSFNYLSITPAAANGKLVSLTMWPQSAGGSTVVGLHINSNSTAATTDTQTISAGTPLTFTFSSNNTFSQNDELSFSVNPTNSINGMACQIVLEYDL